MSWLWWKQGGEIAALRTDLTAAYAELETLRARPEVVSAPPPVPSDAGSARSERGRCSRCPTRRTARARLSTGGRGTAPSPRSAVRRRLSAR